MDYTVHGILQARILKWVAFLFLGDLPNPGIRPRSPTLQVDSLPAEPQGALYLINTVVEIFPNLCFCLYIIVLLRGGAFFFFFFWFFKNFIGV